VHKGAQKQQDCFSVECANTHGQPVHLSVYLSNYLSIYLFVTIFIDLFIYVFKSDHKDLYETEKHSHAHTCTHDGYTYKGKTN